MDDEPTPVQPGASTEAPTPPAPATSDPAPAVDHPVELPGGVTADHVATVDALEAPDTADAPADQDVVVDFLEHRTPEAD